jgi:hypothetical protein
MATDDAQLDTRLQVLEAVMLALVRTHPDPAPLLVEFDRAIARVLAYHEHTGDDLAGQRLQQQAARVRLQLEPE